MSAGVLSMDELVVAVVLSWPSYSSSFPFFLYRAPSSGIYLRFALNKYFIIIIIIIKSTSWVPQFLSWRRIYFFSPQKQTESRWVLKNSHANVRGFRYTLTKRTTECVVDFFFFS